MKTPKFWKNLNNGQKIAWIGVFGSVIVVLLAFILPKMFPEKPSPTSPTYVSNGNNGDTLQGNGNVLDKSTKYFYGVTNKPTLHFVFSLSTAQSDKVDLTNDFLVIKVGEKHKVPGTLYVPADHAEQSNLTLNIWPRNDSPFAVDDVEISIFVPRDWQCVPGAGWLAVEPVRPNRVGDIIETSPNRFITNAVQIWAFRLSSPLLAGDGFETPSIHLNQIQMNAILNGSLAIAAKTKNSPAGSADSAISFKLCVWPESIFTSNDFHKPFVATKMESTISQERLKQLQD